MWNLEFISEQDFKAHVRRTIDNYMSSFKSISLKEFNKNIIDPVKFAFDKALFNISWQELINNEVTRQRDKTNNNYIGYFHQHIFKYMNKCVVPPNGKEGGWDVIYRNPDGIFAGSCEDKAELVRTIYVEMKNKHNTMNSASAEKTYKKMQQQILDDDCCACFLVEAIASTSQNIKWELSFDKRKHSHNKIRRVSMDQFYAIVTGQSDAFYQVMMALPTVIKEIVAESAEVSEPKDTVFGELQKQAKRYHVGDDDVNLTLAMYMLGFSNYLGFSQS